MTDNEKIFLITKYEQEFSDNSYYGDLTKTTSYTYIKGVIPILLSAPHTVNHFTNGNKKKAELLTGGLVKLLHQLTGCHIIYKNKNDGYNFNNDGSGFATTYKNKIIEIINDEEIELFFDIHGMAEDRYLDIDLGTDYGDNLNNFKLIPETIKLFFEEQGIMNVGFNQLFPASFQRTVTKTTSTLTKIPAVQIEINRIYRDVDYPQNLIKLITSFENLISFFKQSNWVENKRKLLEDSKITDL
ncbi:MAG: hypothetical protein PHW32_00705 [Bacilli bacterium]|nr:hypothetical protein [Bacilli bacterium]MDD4282168.1 hypothetical protein [Bacilli bacterium]MDD4718553.1 hypothetical protein [Bacilli bacterium]